MESSIVCEIIAEKDKMIARARRGTAHDDDKSPADWIGSVENVLEGGYTARHMWIKIAAIALRAVEAIDRRKSA